MYWTLTNRADPRANRLAKRHYTCQSPDSGQFVPPGRCVVLLTEAADALWVSSFPYPQFVKHAWAGAWMCSLFRNEGPIRSSVLIREALAATRWVWGNPPALGMVTFVDQKHVEPKRDFGFCYIVAKFRPCGYTQGGLVALQCLPRHIPPAEAPIGVQLALGAGAW